MKKVLKKSLRECWFKYKALVIMAVYCVVYLTVFFYLEQRNTSYYVIQFGIDAYIPFCEYFIVPYLLWFAYVALAVVYFGIKDQEEGNKMIAFLIVGMTVFLVISAVFPNGHHLRPKTFARDNVFIDMVKKLYVADTSTNVLPSIHVYNSLAVMITVWRTNLLKKHRVIKASLMFLGVSIICSTVLLKQHSMLDVLVAFILGALVYTICYRDEVATHPNMARMKAKLKF
ncbi:MAG: phosphatase PAP2 family protein [Lachnospiraceae bacterium]|nr:phosphatase PAP2 family protein [Lachnospiraceae bacterium]MBQ6993144.1 phosphatase PAP2 family protein [Lachnospiraceae bacterium]